MAVAAGFGLTVILVCSQTWATQEQNKQDSQSKALGGSDVVQPVADSLPSEAARSRFTDRPAVLYHTSEGETLFGVQIKPQLETPAPRPRDYLVLIDTSASKAMGPLALAQQLTRALAVRLDGADRLAIRTINVQSHDLTNGFQPVSALAAAVKQVRTEGTAQVSDLQPALEKMGEERGQAFIKAFRQLDEEYPSGAVSLRDGLPEALAGFDGKAGRQRVIVFMGDGKSIAGPIDDEARSELCKKMVEQEIAFFCVPLGAQMEPANLHGFVSGTGGKCVRFQADDKAETWAARLIEAVAAPIFYPRDCKLPAEVVEAFPGRLPPLRSDSPTLMVGKIKPAAAFTCELAGTLAGKETSVRLSEKMPEPEPENFFLFSMVNQWREQKDRPALLPADRTLAHAYDQAQLSRADLLAKADWAVEKDKLDIALRLYRQASELDPASHEAKAGMNLVDELRSGKLTRAQIKERLKPRAGDQMVRIEAGRGRVVRLAADKLLAQAGGDRQEDPLAGQDNPADRVLENVRARRAISDQQATQAVDDAIRRADRMVTTEPDAAHDFLKRTLEDVRNNPDLSERVKVALTDRLQRSLQRIDITGARVKFQQAQNLEIQAAVSARMAQGARIIDAQNRIREQMRVYHNLMDQAREQEAYRQAHAIRVSLVTQGMPVPTAVVGGYQLALNGFNLREVQELRRVREERFLATLLQVEKSHVPFPDEPPVEYPPAAQWRELSKLRKARYESTTFGSDIPVEGVRLQEQLSKRVHFRGFDDPKTTLTEALDALGRTYDITFDINDKAFKYEQVMEAGKTEVAQPAIPEMTTTLANVIRKVLSRVTVPSGATYIIRRDVVEVTTGQFAGMEKTVRVYPVADLVLPIPNSVNTQVVAQSATIFGLGMLGVSQFAALNPFQNLGGGGLGALGGGLGALGGGLGMLGGIQGGLGGGFNNMGQQGGGQFRGNFQGQGNLGVGGGVVGFGGQQLGQFGNLGGQFGLQGGNQSQILITVIRQVVGRPKDWALQYDPINGTPLDPTAEGGQDQSLVGENNQLGFYPPAMALVVKASSTIHTRPSNLIISGGAAGGAGPMGALPRDRGGDRLAVGNRQKNDNQLAALPEEKADGPPPNPKKVWQEKLSRGVTEPGLIIATADFLAATRKFEHAAEFLKANLRLGIVVQPWVYQALAIALKQSNGSLEEIERAEVSSADLSPLDSQGYLNAAHSLAENKRYGRALALCRQSALVEPSLPYAYADALDYAELAKDTKAMEWAAGHLLQQDWPYNNQTLQDKARRKLQALASGLLEAGRKDESDRLLETVDAKQQRDLVIKLSWQGQADLDLQVLEPSGSICSPLHRQTIGGGILIGDSLADMTNETYLAAQAFSGEYRITVEKMWGQPLGGRAQLRIIRHQGTADQTEEVVTVPLDSRYSRPITVQLDGGRRKHTAYVAPPSLQKPPEPSATPGPQGTDLILHKLRLMADPEITSYTQMRGAAGGPGQTSAPSRRPSRDKDLPEQTLYQTRVSPFVANSLDVTAQAVISADRRSVRLSMSPVFNTAVGLQMTAQVVNPVIPGGVR